MLVSCGTGKDAFVVAETIFPPWGTMIVVDVLLAAIAVAASTVVFRRRIDLRRGGALPGVACVLSGLWVVACLHIADFFYKIAQPLDRGASAIASLHFTYSVYVYALSAVLVFVGLILTVVRFTRQLHDIEDRTEALQENESILDSIFENLPFGLLIKNSDHVVERPNRTYLAWYGENIEQMVGHRSEHVEGFQPDDDAHVMNAQEDEVLKTGKLVHRQVERFFVDGKLHTLSITKFPVHDRDGNITKVGSITVDVTDLVQAEEAMREALAVAERANLAKSQFIATMSHEFRTPLNAILGFSEMLRGEYFGPLGSESYRDYARDIHDSGEHLLRLVNDILDIAAIEAGKRSLQKVDFDIAEVLGECLRNVEHSAYERDISLDLQVPVGLPVLHADRKAVAQILLNILANAVKYTRIGGEVGISVKAGDGELTICVTDTGIGISDDLLGRVTEPFAKGQSNPHVAESGTGLGLSIVKSLVDAHGGRLAITSEDNLGTAVYVTLPC